jgi:iron complex outermembrane receptor protein
MTSQASATAHGSRRFLLSSAAFLMIGSAAYAQDAAPNQAASADAAAPAASGIADVVATNTVSGVTVLAPAMHVSPSNVPLNVIQPTSTVPSGFIANNIIPLASYDDIIKFQPSVWSQNPNGPGIGKAESITMRGFQDGQYNVTFDGIPFGDASDLHHTSSALFIAHDLAEAEVDRGPGTASTMGNATFGGTVGFRTKEGPSGFSLNPYVTYGSFNTKAEGLEVNTGKSVIGDAYVDFQHEETDGYLTGSAEQRTNFLMKDTVELAPETTLTFLGTYNREHQATTQGATLAQYQQFGDDYGLCNDKTLQCYSGYNGSNYYSDFEYIKLQTRLFGWLRLDDQVYTDAFGHSYEEGKDASDNNAADNGITFYSPTKIGTKVATYATDVPGKAANARFRALGDTLNLSADTPWGEVKAGFWFDQAHDARSSDTIDLTQGSIPVPAKTGSAYSYALKDVSSTYQPYVEFDWKPLPGLVITPGVKYSDFYRHVDATINKNTKTPLDYGESFNAVLPSIAANYTILPGWTAYIQTARGFLAPPIDVFEVNQIAALKPETTWNYQIGTAVHRPRWMLGADLYNINFSNYLASTTINVAGLGSESTYVNGGGAIYQGIELEGQYVLGQGFSLYGNYSYNQAKYKNSDVTIAEAPKQLAAFGLLYDNRQGPYFSIIGKYVGEHYGLDSTTTSTGATAFQDQYKIGGFVTADLALGWAFREVLGPLHNITPSVKVSNLFDSHQISDFAGNQSTTSTAYPDGAPLYWRVPGRSVFFNLTALVF